MVQFLQKIDMYVCNKSRQHMEGNSARRTLAPFDTSIMSLLLSSFIILSHCWVGLLQSKESCPVNDRPPTSPPTEK